MSCAPSFVANTAKAIGLALFCALSAAHCIINFIFQRISDSSHEFLSIGCAGSILLTDE